MNRMNHLFIGAAGITVFFISGGLCGGMIADIEAPVTTEFGTYCPVDVSVVPQVPVYTVDADLSNVDDMDRIPSLSETEAALLQRNHFVVRHSQYKQMYDIYNECTWGGMPLFVTTDAVLHIYHVLFDQILAEMEAAHMVSALSTLNSTLITGQQTVYNNAQSSQVREAARRNMAFLSVSQALLNDGEFAAPEPVSALVDSELVLIQAHDGFHMSPVFGGFSELDYSQFQPRGHYTKSETLKAYFNAMMWHGLTIFTMEPQKFGDLSVRHTLQALLLTQQVYSLNAGGQSLLDIWSSIYEPTSFLVGRTDDPNLLRYKTIAENVYGADFPVLTGDDLNQTDKLDDFMTRACLLPEPKIPNWIYGTFVTYRGFRFMGQRFIPDSYMFAHLVLPDVPERYFPKGLDVMAALGSGRAETLLDSVYHETSYAGYTIRLDAFKHEFQSLPDRDWAQNLYWNWLYCLMPLLDEKGAGYPPFMQNVAWTDKALMTALASWAELRHDTILYAKQSMTPCCMAPEGPRSYVEPDPHLYARLAALVRFTRSGLAAMNMIPKGYSDKLDLFDSLLVFLMEISIKELQNESLTRAEYDNIYCFGSVMEDLVSEVKDPEKPWDKSADDMAVVADVHTDSNTDFCLEEGVGYPLEIFVIVYENGRLHVTRGSVFSYYEFTRPTVQRLTDEAWRDMLAGREPPNMPRWTGSFMDVSAPRPDLGDMTPDNLFPKEFTDVEEHAASVLPANVVLYQNHPNPFNPATTISYALPGPSRVLLTVYNVLGEEMVTLVDDVKQTGLQTAEWDGLDRNGRPVPTGVYMVRLVTSYGIETRKMFLLK